MDGALTVESESGKGSTFRLVVPLPLGEEQIAPPAAREPIAPVPGAEKLRILVAEDNQVNAMVARSFLTRLGYRPEVAADGRRYLEAIARAREEGDPFALVFMDVEMPEMDGFETARAIRAGQAGEADRAVPVVAMTAHAVKGFRERCLEAGMDDYVSKPVDFPSLPGIIDRFRGGRGG